MSQRAKKSLGQHFLTSPAVVRALCDAADISAGDYVIEIGPGTGILTEALLDRGARVHAIEKDEQLVSLLEEKFSPAVAGGSLTISAEDVLDFSGALPGDPDVYSVVANIPYYITGAILRLFLSAAVQPNHMALLVQKEIAERIVKRDGKESILSLSVALYGTPKLIRSVRPGAFSPPPKVTSAILAITDIGREKLDLKLEPLFFSLIKRGFGHKRKQVVGNLSETKEDRTYFTKLLTSLGLHATVRAEDISLNQWIALTESVARRQGV